MKLDEKTAIPVPREGRESDIKERDNSNIGRSYEGHHGFAPSHYPTYDRERSPPRPEKGQLDRPSRYTHITSQSAPVLATQSENAHSSRQNPISLEKMPLNEREKKWWDELRETAGKLADFASFVHRTGRIPPRNDLDWARSIFQIFAENMSALQMVSGVLQGEGPRFPDAGLSSLKMSNPSRYGKRLMSQSPTLESGNCKMLSTAFPPPPLNRHVSYDKVIDPDRSMRPSASLTAMTGERSDAPYNRQPPSIYDHRFSNRFEIGPERMDPEHNRWRERSSEPKRTREIGRPDNLPELNRPRDRASSSNGRTYAPSNEQDYSSEIAGPSRSGGNVPPSLTSPLGNFPRHPNDSPRSTYSARETDGFNQRAPLPGQHHSGKPAGLPVPQPPSRPSHAGRRASSDYGGTHYPTSYSPPYNMKSDERYGFRPPTDHYSAQQSAQMSNGYYRDEYRDANQHDQSYVSGDESGSMGFRPSKYRKRSRAPAPGSCVSCGARDTPEWRRGPNGARTLCNACGLHFSKLLRKKKQEEGNESAIVTVEELRSSLKIPGNGSAGQTSPF